jgi:hypothetical protein
LARYNTFKYGSGQTYGDLTASKYSAEPFVAYAQNYNKIVVTWNNPQADTGVTIAKYRLVRSQFAYPETETDGLTIWESTVPPIEPRVNDTTNIAPGRFAFYSLWIQLGDDSWVLTGETDTIVPAKHTSRIYPKFINQNNVAVAADILLQTTHERLLSYLPRVFTAEYWDKGTTEKPNPEEPYLYTSPTGNINTDRYNKQVTLSMFLEGFSFTIDEFLTYGELILPGLSGRYSNAATIKLQGDQLGVPEDTQGLTKTQKYFVRDAIYIYSKKGTLTGLNRFIKSLTGYSPTTTVSGNEMLSLQNSTFYESVGGWKATNDVSISALNTSDVPTVGGSDLVVEQNWIAKIDCSSSGSSIYLGSENPILESIPVVAGQEYSFTYWVKRDSNSGSIFGQSILWYDQKGNRIDDNASQVGQTVTTSWVRKTYTKTAPTGAVFASLGLTFNSGTIYYLDRVQFSKSNVTDYSEARSIQIYLNPSTYFTQTRVNKVPRLNAEISKYLPINRAYFITSSAGFESSGITS